MCTCTFKAGIREDSGVNPDRHYFVGSGSASAGTDDQDSGLRPDRTYKKICIIFSNIVVTSDVNYRHILMLKSFNILL